MSNMNDLPGKVAAPVERMKTVGYRIVGNADTPVSAFVFDKLVPGIKPEQHESVVLRREAEAAIEAETEHLRHFGLAWEESAAFHHRNEEFWSGLVRRIGRAVAKHDIGVHIADDNTWNPEPLALKVVESIEKSYAPKNRFQRALRILITGK